MKAQKNTSPEKKDKILGGMVGFVIGDALGLPIAGMKENEVTKHIGKVTEYITNFRHPYFYFLKKGQYGSNSRLMIAALESLAENKSYRHEDLKKRLISIAKKSKEDFFYSRWLGETVTKGILGGKPIESNSCTCIYRSIPLALLLNDLEEVLSLSEKQSLLTHASGISLASSYLISSLLFHLKNGGSSARLVIEECLSLFTKKYKGVDKLSDNLTSVLEGRYKTLREAKMHIGTGSLSYQTIPLGIYIYLKSGQDFEKAVVEGANCYRSNQVEKDLQYVSYIEEMMYSRGGGTDSVAGVVGLLIGTEKGYSHIPKKFLTDLEDRDKIKKLTEEFFK